MIQLERINDEVFVAAMPIVALGDEETQFVKQQATSSPRRRARICTHQANTDALHEMLIAISAESYIHPHKHISKSESFHVVEGLVDVIIFDDAGEITNVVELGAHGSGRSYYYRLSSSKFHTLIIRSELVVLHEVTNGPFDKTQTILAPFAPPEEASEAAKNYIRHISNQAEQFNRRLAV